MNVKTLAAIVGTLSLGSLATGCATAKPAAASTPEKSGSSDYACKVDAASAKQVDTTAASTATADKGGEHKCGNGSCGGTTHPQ